MKKVFIAGSRKIKKLNAGVLNRIDHFLEEQLPILVGDANGVDKSVQLYLQHKGYRLVEVFCSGELCRNNVGQWPQRFIRPNSQRRDFQFYAAKDREMANEASFGLMIWDGKSQGTLLNIFRLLRQKKKVIVYREPDKDFSELENQDDWENFASIYSIDIQRVLEVESIAEENPKAAPRQISLI